MTAATTTRRRALPGWESDNAYTDGDEVSHESHNWNATQWNYNQKPGSSTAWHDEGSCTAE